MHCYNTRQSVNLDLPSVQHANTTQRSFQFCSVNIWNSLSANTRSSQSSASFNHNVSVNYVPNYKSNFDFFFKITLNTVAEYVYI